MQYFRYISGFKPWKGNCGVFSILLDTLRKCAGLIKISGFKHNCTTERHVFCVSEVKSVCILSRRSIQYIQSLQRQWAMQRVITKVMVANKIIFLSLPFWCHNYINKERRSNLEHFSNFFILGQPSSPGFKIRNLWRWMHSSGKEQKKAAMAGRPA